MFTPAVVELPVVEVIGVELWLVEPSPPP